MVLALKEWAIAVEALLSGEQCLLLRKGGIHEETKQFELKSPIFLLFPAFEHQKEVLVQSEYVKRLVELRTQGMSNPLALEAYARVEKEWLIDEAEILDQLADFHIWTKEMIEARLHWKKTQPLHVIAVRIYRLKEALLLNNPADYAGCKSWFELPFSEEQISFASDPVMSDTMIQCRIAEIEERIAKAKEK